jgi:hypothetical protein
LFPNISRAERQHREGRQARYIRSANIATSKSCCHSGPSSTTPSSRFKTLIDKTSTQTLDTQASKTLHTVLRDYQPVQSPLIRLSSQHLEFSIISSSFDPRPLPRSPGTSHPRPLCNPPTWHTPIYQPTLPPSPPQITSQNAVHFFLHLHPGHCRHPCRRRPGPHARAHSSAGNLRSPAGGGCYDLHRRTVHRDRDPCFQRSPGDRGCLWRKVLRGI